MDVPYTSSGASSRAQYAVVRGVENAKSSRLAEKLLADEVQRLRRKLSESSISTSDLRSDLIILLYCLNASSGSVTPTSLVFALPSAVHLAEAGKNVSEKHMGYLFCLEVMPSGHELELMLVNTIRKDLNSSSIARMALALNALIYSPSFDIIPAVQNRIVQLLSHPSSHVKVLGINALRSLSRLGIEILHGREIQDTLLQRLKDGDGSVTCATLRLCTSMIENELMKLEDILAHCISIVHRIVDKREATTFTPAFQINILRVLCTLIPRGHTLPDDLCPSLLIILRRAVRANNQPLILENFRLISRLSPSSVAQHLRNISPRSPEIARTTTPTATDSAGGSEAESAVVSNCKDRRVGHPVAQIRHFLSSRSLSEHYLFLSCVACLDPSLWAGPRSPVDNQDEASVIPPVLDQWEVERVLGSLESEDEGVRSLTLHILTVLDPSLVEGLYERALLALRPPAESGGTQKHDSQRRNRTVTRVLEFAFATTLGVKGHGEREEGGSELAEKVKIITDSLGYDSGVESGVVEAVLGRIKSAHTSNRRQCIISFFSFIDDNASPDSPNTRPVTLTFMLIFLALSCEFASTLSLSQSEVRRMICRFAALSGRYPASIQEPMFLCMTRLLVILSDSELRSSEMKDAAQLVHRIAEEAGDRSSGRNNTTIMKRCEQFLKAFEDPQVVRKLLDGRESVSLPDFAFTLDLAVDAVERIGRAPLLVPTSPPASTQSLDLSRTTSANSMSQSKLRYAAYAPPPAVSPRFGRDHSLSVSSTSSRQTSRRSSSGTSSNAFSGPRDGTDLSKTVTAGDLTLAMASTTLVDVSQVHKKGMLPEPKLKESELESHATTSLDPNLIALDSPFLPEPLAPVPNPSTPTSPYVSASTSLHTTPEPELGPSFEAMWSAYGSELGHHSARGWSDDLVENVVRQLQGLGAKMDVVAVDVAPFEGDLKIVLRASDHYDVGGLPESCALLRLHEEEDGSCLWQGRCNDQSLLVKVREILK